MDKIITNKIKCRKCGDVLESVFTHDLKRCKCGSVEIDGGKEYLRRSAKNIDDFIELSTVKMNIRKIFLKKKFKMMN